MAPDCGDCENCSPRGRFLCILRKLVSPQRSGRYRGKRQQQNAATRMLRRSVPVRTALWTAAIVMDYSPARPRISRMAGRSVSS